MTLILHVKTDTPEGHTVETKDVLSQGLPGSKVWPLGF